MARFINLLSAFSFLLIALLASTSIMSSGHTENLRLSQNITVDYLERLLVDLKERGEVPPSATICDVKWINYGVVVSLNCTESNLKYSRGADTKTPVGALHKEQHNQVPIAVSNTTINGDPRIDCSLATDTGNPFCTDASLELYQNNIEAPWLVSAVDVCNSVLSALSLDVSAALSCKGTINFSSIELREGHGDTLGGGQPTVYINAAKASGEPPVYRVMVVASPHDMVDANGRNFYERFEYLVFWTFEMDGRISVSAEVLNSFQGNLNHNVDHIRDLDLNSSVGIRTLNFIPGTSRPALFRDAIVTKVREMTVRIRDSAFNRKLGAN
jgi:hypothetical protein